MHSPARRVALTSIAALALALVAAPPAEALSTTVAISQVYGGAGCSAAGCSTYKNDFVELFNLGTAPVSLAGLSVQYASAAGSFNAATVLPNVTLQPGQYFLVAEASGATGVNSLPAPDATGTIAMSATAGKIILASSTTALACGATGSSAAPCSAAQQALIIDLVGYGTTATLFEGTGAAPAPSTTTADVRGANGCTESDQNASDFAARPPDPRNTASALNPCSSGPGPSTPVLSINDVSVTEGNAGTVTASFTVSLSAAASGAVTFDIGTADDTATTADGDYVASSLLGQSIAAGDTTYSFNVTVNGDTTIEPDERFFVNVTNVTGATLGKGQGAGTIRNDDVTLRKIHDLQGSGALSPFVNQSVTTTGIVTGVKSNGFFIQEPDASVDDDPATSEGVFVFTSSTPPAVALAGNNVQVTGTVSEYVPSSDPNSPPMTEIVGPAVSLISTSNPLPAPIPLTPAFPDPAGAFDQLERLEGMRVSVASLTVTAPTQGTISEANATSTSSGVFYGVVTGVPRPFLEPGIPVPDDPTIGSMTIPPIPRYDSNPERLRVDSDGLTAGRKIDVGTGAVLTGVVGPLDYALRCYTILLDPPPAAQPSVSGGPTPKDVTTATTAEFTVATYNMQRFFDTTDDPGSDVRLTADAFERRLAKASLAIRHSMKNPDIMGVEEMEHLSTLQALSARISADAIASSEPDPQYAAYLSEGNDVGGIDVGFLVKTATVYGSTPRVTVTTVVQELAGTLFANPDGSTELLNDRPPLRLMAVVNHPNGAGFPVTVIVNHLKAISSVNDPSAGSHGWPTVGARERGKRQKQAEDLANLVQARQLADPAERIVLVGDFNAYEFNDGYGDLVNTIAGTPPPDDQTVVPGDGVDLVNPDLVNLVNTPPPAERYSYTYDGNAQNLDHILVNAPLVSGTTARRIEHARVNADFPDVLRNDGTTPARLSDHDPIVAFFQVAAFATSDLALQGGDISVRVSWRNQYSGEIGTASGLPEASPYGYSYFFEAGNPEVFVKALDGGPQTPYVLFWASLTDFEYTITFTNTATGKTLEFVKPAGTLDGGTDTRNLPHGTSFGALWSRDGATWSPIETGETLATARTRIPCLPTWDTVEIPPGPAGPELSQTSTQAAPPEGGANELLLQDGVIGASVTWRDPASGETGTGVPIARQDQFGYFYLLEAADPEVFVKVLDWGTDRPYLLFWAGLTDREFTVTFRNTLTGESVTKTKAAGPISGGVDTTSLTHTP